jgi:hypothetical protein
MNMFCSFYVLYLYNKSQAFSGSGGGAVVRMLAALEGSVENALFFAGDLGQRIFREPFSWLALGVDIRGRSQTLKVNYRTSHQIRQAVDKLLPAGLRDVDGNEEGRSGVRLLR